MSGASARLGALFVTAAVACLIAACGQAAGELSEQLPAESSAASDAGATPDATPRALPTATYPPDTLAGVTIALDAGHGGGDDGAAGYCVDVEVLEVDVNLRTRELLRDLLAGVGASVYLVPQPPQREARVEVAEASGADVLLSIHHNGSDDPAYNYTMTYISDDVDLALATHIHPRLIDALALSDSGVQYEDFGITSHGSIPAILTEASFITNSIEACNFLGNQSRIRAEALALFHGLVDYFRAAGLASG
jgi:N-acetylmuramoyl-L-alanine amidase